MWTLIVVILSQIFALFQRTLELLLLYGIIEKGTLNLTLIYLFTNLSHLFVLTSYWMYVSQIAKATQHLQLFVSQSTLSQLDLERKLICNTWMDVIWFFLMIVLVLASIIVSIIMAHKNFNLNLSIADNITSELVVILLTVYILVVFTASVKTLQNSVDSFAHKNILINQRTVQIQLYMFHIWNICWIVRKTSLIMALLKGAKLHNHQFEAHEETTIASCNWMVVFFITTALYVIFSSISLVIIFQQLILYSEPEEYVRNSSEADRELTKALKKKSQVYSQIAEKQYAEIVLKAKQE